MNLRSRRNREEVTIELTPLIDVVFLLLIFFLLTSAISQAQNANTSRESSIAVELPTGESGSSTVQQNPLTLTVTDDGEVEIDGGPEDLPGGSIEDKLTELYKQDPDAQILLRGDRGASHGDMMELLDAVRQIGFKKVDFIIAKPKAQP